MKEVKWIEEEDNDKHEPRSRPSELHQLRCSATAEQTYVVGATLDAPTR